MEKKMKVILLMMTALTFSGCKLVPDGSIAWENQSAENVVTENNHAAGVLVNDTVYIDADISGTDKTDWKEYTAALRKIDEEEALKISGILLGEKSRLKSENENSETKDGTSVYYYESEDSKDNLIISSGKVYLNTSKSKQLQYPSFFMPSGELLDEKEMKERFPLDTLEGLDRENVIAQFKEICSEINLDISDNIKLYAIDKDSANKIRDEEEWVSLDKNDNKTPDWTQEDEVYLIIAPLQLNGTELPIKNTSSQTGYSYTSVVYSVIGRDGVCLFNATGLYQMDDEKAVADVHTVNDVMDYLATNYSYLTEMNQSITVTDIKLQYIARYYISDNEYKIIPTWVCTKETKVTGSKEGENVERTRTDYLYIDAQNMTSFSG
jgi:hypothetical protein